MIEHILFKITEEEEEEDESVALDAPPFGTWAHKINFNNFVFFVNFSKWFHIWQYLKS